MLNIYLIKRKMMTKKEFFEKSNSVDIANLRKITEWIHPREETCLSKIKNKINGKKPVDSRARFDEAHLMLRDNKKYLTEKYGKQEFCVSDSQKRRLYVWFFEVSENINIWIITAPSRGTSIEYTSDIEEGFEEEIMSKLRDVFSLKIM